MWYKRRIKTILSLAIIIGSLVVMATSPNIIPTILNNNSDNNSSNNQNTGNNNTSNEILVPAFHINPLPLPNISDWDGYLINLTNYLVTKAFLLRDTYNASQSLIPRYNFLKNQITSYTPDTLVFLLYAYEITKNVCYLYNAIKSGFEMIQQNMTTDPAYFFWLYNRTGVLAFYNYGVKLADGIMKEIQDMGIPHKEGKTYYLPWGIMTARLGPLLESYQITGNRTYLNRALKFMLDIFKYLKSNKTGLLYNSYRFLNSSLTFMENYSRVYVPGLVITALVFLYLHTNNATVYQLLKNYVNSVITYFWVSGTSEVYVQKGDELYVMVRYIKHWAYRVFVNTGKPAWPTIETNFFKLDYALFLYYMYIEKNETILKMILQDLNTSIIYDTVNYIFRHSLLDLTGLFHGQLGSLIYLISALKKLDIADYTKWLEKHFLAVFTAFTKEYGVVYSIRLRTYRPARYNPYLALTSTAYIYGMQKYIENVLENASIYNSKGIYYDLPFPFRYDPNVEIPLN